MSGHLKQPNPTGSAQQKLLLVEADHEMFARVILSVEEEAGHRYTLDWAATHKFALSLLRRSNYDLVLVRNRLGFQTGVEFIESMRNAGIETPAILLIEEERADYVDHSLYGIWDCLDIRRFDGSMLVKTIREATANARQLRGHNSGTRLASAG